MRQHAFAVSSNDSHFDVVDGIRRIAFRTGIIIADTTNAKKHPGRRQ